LHGFQAGVPHILPPLRGVVSLLCKMLLRHGFVIRRADSFEQRGIVALAIPPRRKSIRDTLQIVARVTPEAALAPGREPPHVPVLRNKGSDDVRGLKGMTQMFQLQHVTFVGRSRSLQSRHNDTAHTIRP
jgi:hypothetical protein